jgi:glycosyltransferase involved in cell wall biosynthesis
MSISVIVPVYNSEDTIAACIESILNQSYTDLELIVVDDGSTDDSGKICDGYVTRDHRVHVIHQENKGRTEARWVGVNQSTGDWICFVDSDDTLPVNSLQLLQSAVSDNTDIVLGNGYSIFPESRSIIPIEEFRHLAVRSEGTIGVPWGSLYRRTVVTHELFDIPRHIMMGEDYIFWLRLVFSTEKVVNVVYESVYNKGKEHTCNTFYWTSDYCYELNELRKSAIPLAQHEEFLSEMVDDRIVNLFAVVTCEPRKKWKQSPFYLDILSDLKKLNRKFTLKQRIFLIMPHII